MSSIKSEAIVLRSIRFGEADRILHLYTPEYGRIGAIAKGARKPTSRFGARLEPFMRVRMVLREGRGDLYTVTGAVTPSAGCLTAPTHILLPTTCWLILSMLRTPTCRCLLSRHRLPSG
jgi:Recombination protein O N terminal